MKKKKTSGNDRAIELKFYSYFKRLGNGCANHDTEGKRFKSPIHCCDATKPPYLFTMYFPLAL